MVASAEFPIVQFECEKGHEWQSPVPNYSISLKGCCPECNGDAVSMKSAGHIPLEELKQRLRRTEDE